MAASCGGSAAQPRRSRRCGGAGTAPWPSAAPPTPSSGSGTRLGTCRREHRCVPPPPGSGGRVRRAAAGAQPGRPAGGLPVREPSARTRVAGQETSARFGGARVAVRAGVGGGCGSRAPGWNSFWFMKCPMAVCAMVEAFRGRQFWSAMNLKKATPEVRARRWPGRGQRGGACSSPCHRRRSTTCAESTTSPASSSSRGSGMRRARTNRRAHAAPPTPTAPHCGRTMPLAPPIPPHRPPDPLLTP